MKEFRTRLGQVVLIERLDVADVEPMTGVVLESRTTGIVALDLMAEPTETLDGASVLVSVFAPEAMYRARATLRVGEGHRAELDAVEPEEAVQRRRWPRRQVTLPVSVIAVDDAAPAGVTGETLDISVGGVRILTHAPLPAGSDPLVAITLPAGDVLMMLGRVVHSSQSQDTFTYGVVFPDIEGDDAARLSELVAMTAYSTA